MIAAVTYLVGGAIAFASSVVDLRDHRLPNRNSLALAVIALIGFGLSAAFTSDEFPVVDLALATVIFTTPWLVTHLISPAGIGFGDVKFAAALGPYLGWQSISTALTALFATAVVSIAALAIHYLAARRTPAPDRRRSLPFGPALFAATVIAVVPNLS